MTEVMAILRPDPFYLLFDVPGVPVAKGRGRIITIGGHGAIKTPQKTKDYESWVAFHGRRAMAGVGLVGGPLHVTVVAVFPHPESWSGKRKAAAKHHTSRPDLDNVTKAVTDALNGVCFADDAAICELLGAKRYVRAGELPHVKVTIWALP